MSEKDQIVERRKHQIGKVDWIVFGVLAVFCFFTFQQGDILHTGGSSFAYLNGHFLDFYEYNAQYLGENNYLPSTYILFAIWNIPIRLFGLVTVPTTAVPRVVVFWYKLLPTLFYLASGWVMYKTLLLLNSDNKQAKLGMFIFLSTPISFFSQFIFGQYDSFTMFFMMLGIYYWIKDDMVKFSLFFGVALTFKYTALLIYVPLLLLREKRYLRIFANLALVAALFVLEVAIYFRSAAFSTGVGGFGAVGYITAITFQALNFPIAVVIVLWLLVCGFAFFKRAEDKPEMFKWGLYLSALVCFLVFGLCQWHPQWLLFMTPFIVLGIVYHRDSDAFLILDLMLMAAFTLVTVSWWTNHVDQNLIMGGVLAPLLVNKGGFPIIMRDLIHAPLFINSYSAYAGLLLVTMVFKHPRLLLNEVSQKLQKSSLLIRLRYVGGIAMFVVPAMICFTIALLRPDVVMYDGGMADHIGPLSEQSELRQYFALPGSEVTEIGVAVGTYMKENHGTMTLRLYDAETDMMIYETEVDVNQFKDNEYFTIDVPDTKLEALKQYYFEFKLDKEKEDDYIAIYRSAEGTATYSNYAMIDGEIQNYSLCVRLYGKVD